MPAASSPMRNARSAILGLALLGVSALLAAGSLLRSDEASAQGQGGFAYSIELTGGIDPSAQFGLERGLTEAKRRRAAMVIVRLDTPGGTLSDTREMVKDITAAPMPVIVYVHPGGAHAESAGLFLTLAGDVAAMAPGTNIGSATPFLVAPRPRTQEQRDLLKILERKGRNDAIAWARALAEQHGRNANLAERMVSDAVNVSAGRARRQRLIDVVATSERALLGSLDGFRIQGPKAQVLRTAGLSVEHAKIANEPTDSGESGDKSSLIRSLALIVVVFLAIGLGLYMLGRGRGALRRRRRLRRHRRRQRRQAPSRDP